MTWKTISERVTYQYWYGCYNAVTILTNNQRLLDRKRKSTEPDRGGDSGHPVVSGTDPRPELEKTASPSRPRTTPTPTLRRGRRSSSTKTWPSFKRSTSSREKFLARNLNRRRWKNFLCAPPINYFSAKTRSSRKVSAAGSSATSTWSTSANSLRWQISEEQLSSWTFYLNIYSNRQVYWTDRICNNRSVWIWGHCYKFSQFGMMFNKSFKNLTSIPGSIQSRYLLT